MLAARFLLPTLGLALLAGCSGGRVIPPPTGFPDATAGPDDDAASAQPDAAEGPGDSGEIAADASGLPDADPPPPPDAGTPDTGTPDSGQPDAGGGGRCLRARLLWSDGFESGNFQAWSSARYGFDTSTCNESMISRNNARSGTFSARAEVTCVKTDGQSHRPYGGVQFSGDRPLATYTNNGVGINAPNGVVTTQWGWLDVPYNFGNGRWFSHWTLNNACDYSDAVMTLGVSDARRSIETAHVTSTGGTVRYAPNAPTMPLRQWVRTTVYISYVHGEMTVWMDGQKVMDASFTRRVQTMCQFHWGLYASPNNSDIEYYDDDISIHRLDERLTDRENEPWFGNTVSICP